MRRLALALSTLLLSCGGSSGADLGIPDACNPLGHPGLGCMMPWPSSAFLIDGEAGVALPAEAMPVNQDDIAIDPETWNRYDGFSPSGAIVAAFPGGVSAEGLPPHTDPAASLANDAPIALVEVTSGARVLVFAEVDMNVAPELRTLLIRPLERLKGGTRYAVGIRDTVKAADGTALVRSPGFQAMLDRESPDHPRFAAATGHADELLAALAGAGMPEASLVLAWDFVTATDASITADLLTMRDLALPAMGETGDALTFDLEEVAIDSPEVYQGFVGTYDVPSFLSEGESNTTRITRDAAGAPALDGLAYRANLAAVIPACVTTATLPLETIVFGHGLFGSGEGYITEDLLQGIANDNCVVVLASDWIGLSERQLDLAVYAANDLNKSNSLSDMLGQSVINFIALEQLVRGGLRTSAALSYQGQPVIDADRVYYLGGSLGGIMGGTFMAYDPTILRGVLGVPGGVWSMLIERSAAWTPLQVASQAAYHDPYTYEVMVQLLGWSFERWDPISTARRVLDDPLPGTPAKQLLLYEAMNDSLVSNLGTETVARTMGLPVTAPSVKQPYGLALADGPVPSALTIYDEHPSPEVPTTNVPPSADNGTHVDVNERAAVMRAALHFLREGDVINECKQGETAMPCDCDTGVCD